MSRRRRGSPRIQAAHQALPALPRARVAVLQRSAARWHGLAAQAAEAAGAQGKFWEMHDQLFGHREHLKPRQPPDYAEDLALDMRSFDFALKHQVYRSRIDEQIEGSA